jgi:hypothetical protein
MFYLFEDLALFCKVRDYETYCDQRKSMVNTRLTLTRLTAERGTNAMYKSSYIGSGGKNAGCKPDKLCRHEFLLRT